MITYSFLTCLRPVRTLQLGRSCCKLFFRLLYINNRATTDKSWHLKFEHISKQYTTNLYDVIHVNCLSK
ncbi:DUF4113 domain-containing protein [uncultured Bacteroides sp.]|uniref:DUF4113 domain-containing protein n=1 Tax=uncultured Bacteroides sp. TaxID=162156 RepID=UPI0034435365